MSKLSEDPVWALRDELIGATSELARLSLERTAITPDLASRIDDIFERYFHLAFKNRAREVDAANRSAEAKGNSRAKEMPLVEQRISELAAANPRRSETWVLEEVADEFGTSRRTIKRHLGK